MSLSWLISSFVSALLLPPLNGLLLVVAGIFLWHVQARLARLLVIAGVLLVSALSLGVVARALLMPLEASHPPLADVTAGLEPVDVIVVLGAGRYRAPPEFPADDVAGPGLERLRYGALLARATGKPLLVTGGMPDGGERAEGEAMRDALRRDFGINAVLVESNSLNTFENARHSAALLLPQDLRRIVLVTHAWHMPRAVAAFERAGFRVLAAPTAYLSSRPLLPADFLPRASAMRETAIAMHEWIGLIWYKLRY